jgi:hypothetical protein
MTRPLSGLDERLKEWGTETQKAWIDAVNLHGGISAAARVLGIHKAAIGRGVQAVIKKAAQAGYSPAHDMTHTVPPGFRVKGVSTYYDRDGLARGQWVKSSAEDLAREEALREFAAGLAEEVKGLAPLGVAPDATLAELLAVYAFGDPHFGMRATAAEGEAFDLAEADRITRAGIDRLAQATPDAETALLLVIGDNTHANDSSHKTPAHGNDLDMDAGGHNRSMYVSARAWSYAARRLAEKHRQVIVWILPGNHDPDAAYALALCLKMYFENEPRIKVDLSTNLYRYLRFGKVLIGSHHGHGAKIADLPLIMAVDRAEDWGASLYRFLYVGHIHHDTVKEVQGVRVESLRTLAAKDAWSANKGYRAMRDTRAIVHHRDFGEIERFTVSAAMLKA